MKIVKAKNMKFKNSLLFVDIHPMEKKGEVCKNFPLSLFLCHLLRPFPRKTFSVENLLHARIATISGYFRLLPKSRPLLRIYGFIKFFWRPISKRMKSNYANMQILFQPHILTDISAAPSVNIYKRS